MVESSFTAPTRLALRGALEDPAWNEQAVRDFAQRLGTREEVARVLIGRGAQTEISARERFDAKLAHLRQPQAMAGYSEAVELLARALEQNLRIGIFGDYDVDGISSTALLASYLQECGGEVIARVASRQGGYGFSVERAQELVQAGAQLVITADCGTSDHEALAWLRAQGIPSVVIDHHQVPKERPLTNAFLNPHQPDCDFSFKGMCSGGVAFYLCAGLRGVLAKKRAFAVPDPRALLDLVAMATVCDMMSLEDNNRILVRRGLSHLSARRRPGLVALLRAAGVPAHVPIDESHIGFVLGPRINAPGRLGAAQPALDLLLSRDIGRADALAREIESINTKRKRHQRDIEAQANAQVLESKLDESAAIVAYSEDWLPGVVGIAASGLAQRYRRPALVLGRDPSSGRWRGSSRSFGGANVYAALQSCSEILEAFGGHTEAAGLSVAPEQLEALREGFCAAIDAQKRPASDTLYHDGALSLDTVNPHFLQALREVGPFGMDFPEPLFELRGVEVSRLKIVGGNHLSLGLQSPQGRPFPAIAFGAGQAPLRPGSRIDALAVPAFNDFAGRRQIQLRVSRLWPSEN